MDLLEARAFYEDCQEKANTALDGNQWRRHALLNCMAMALKHHIVSMKKRRRDSVVMSRRRRYGEGGLRG